MTVLGPFLSFRPNRVVDGISATALQSFGVTGWLLIALWVTIAALTLTSSRPAPALVRGLLGHVGLGIALASSGGAAAAYAAGQGTVARTSFDWAFYVMLFGLFLVQYSASAGVGSFAGRAVIVWAGIAIVVGLSLSGALAELGILREWLLARDTFAREFRTHLVYALGATGAAVALGIPLGVLSARSRTAETPIMGVLNLGQVFPALAFIGIMMPVLGALADRVPLLKALGVAGIGWAPVFIVLLIWALFPVVRNTLVAIRQLDPSVLDAARGMGMGRWRLLFEVELPLAFPIVLAGIRIALVQSTSGAILAAFVGGGGLGTVMFLGLEQTSMDLVLVGVLPIVALALVFDSGLRAIERLTGGAGAYQT